MEATKDINRIKVVLVEQKRTNAVNSALNKMSTTGGLTLAADDEPGFRVKWRDWSRKTAWEDAGFEVSATPTNFIVTHREARNG